MFSPKGAPRHSAATASTLPLSLLVCAAMLGSRAGATEEVWVGSSGNWSAGANWLDGTPPDPAAGATLTLRFPDSASTGYAATNDLAEVFPLNAMRFETQNGGSMSAGGRILRLEGVAPVIQATGPGVSSVAGSGSNGLILASDGVTFQQSGAGELRIFGSIAESGGSRSVTIAGQPASVDAGLISLTGPQSFTGPLVLQSGNLALAANGSAGSLVINGGTLRFVSGGGTPPFAKSVSLNSDLVVVGTDLSTSINFTQAISSATPGTGLTLRGNSSGSTLALSAASTYSGATRIGFGPLSTSSSSTGGTIRLTGNGSLLNSSLFDIRDGGVLQIEVPTGTAPNRIRDAAPLELRSGELLFGGGSGLSPQRETVGPLRIGGHSLVTIAPAITVSTRLTSASLTRLGRGTALFRGTNLGGAFAANTANVLFTTPPRELVGGNGSGPDVSILPYAIGDTARTGTGSGFVTYSASTGIRALAPSEYASFLPTGASTQNVKLSGPVTHPGAATVNSLLLAGGSVAGNGTLSISSGAVLNTSIATIENALDFGTTDGKFFAPLNLTVSGPISGSGGLTKSSNGTLTLSAASNPFTGPLTINAGSIAFDAVGQLGNENSAIVIGGHTAGLLFTGPETLTLSRDLAVESGIARLDASGPGVFELSGTISGNGGLRLGGSGRTVRLTGANSFTGPVFIRFGVTEISSDAALGNGGELTIGGGTLRLLAPLSVARTTLIDFGGTIDTGAFDSTWSGLLLGSGVLGKGGAGTLTISNASPFFGGVLVREGTLRLAGDGMLRSPNFTVSSGARLVLDNAATSRTSRISDSATITLNGGELLVAGNANGSNLESVGSLVVGSGAGDNVVTLQSAGSFGTSLRSGTLVLNDARLLVRGDALGGASGGAFTRLVVATPPAAVGGLVRDVYAEDVTAGSGVQFAVYDQSSDAAGIVGLRPLRATEQTAGNVIANPSNGGSTPVDANFAAAGDTSANGALNRINSLSLPNGGNLTLAADQTVAIDAGAVLVRPGAATATLAGGTLAFGANAASFTTFGDLSISSMIAGTGGLRKTGAGALMLLTAPGYSGGTTVAEGILRAGSPGLLSGEFVTLGAGGVFDLNNALATVGGLAGTGEVRLGSGTLTLGTLATDMTFDGTQTGSGTLRIVSGGNPGAVRNFTGDSSFAGNVVLDSGRLAFGGTRPLGTAALTVNGGEFLTTAVTTSFNSSANAIRLNTDLIVGGGPELILAAPGSLAGPHDVVVRAFGGLALEVPARHTGETRTTFGDSSSVSFAAGPITLRGATGALTATSAIRIAPGSALVIDDSTAFSGSASGRVPDAAPVFLSSSELQLTGASGVATTETIGALSVSGFTTISVAPAPASTARLIASRLERMNRAGVLVRGPALGSALAPGVAQVSFNAAPAGLIGGGGTGPDTSILPFVVGDASATGSGTGFVTYDPATGLRLLNPATDYTTSLAAAAPTHNVSLAGNETNNAAVAVNSLVLAGDATISGSGAITVTSGAVLGGTSAAGGRRIANRLNFGTVEGHIHGSLTIDGVISGSGGLTKSGINRITLNGANDFTGQLTINSGDIIFSSMANLGADNSPVVFNANVNGAALYYFNPARGPLTFTRDIIANSGYAMLRTVNGGSDLLVPGTISGGGGLGVTGSPSYVVLSGTNTYTGSTLVQGNLAISSDAALGNGGALELKSGNLRLDGPWTTSRPIIASGSAPVITNGHDVVWTGPLIRAGGNLSVSGSGLLTIPTRSDYNGSLGASLRLADQGALPALSSFVGTLQLDNTTTVISDRINDAARVTGTVKLLGNATASVKETVGSFSGSEITLTAPGSGSTILEAASLSTEYYMLYRGDQLGGGPTGAFTRVVAQTAPSMIGGLMPRALVSRSATGSADSFARYDSTVDAAGQIGVRALHFSEYSTSTPVQNPANGGSTSTDAQLLIDGAMTAAGAVNRVNSVTASADGDLTLTAGQRLTVGNGIILAPPGTSARITGGQLATTDGTLQLLGDGNVALGSQFSGTLGKGGTGIATLLAGSAIQGDVFVGAGTLLLEANIGGTGTVQVGISATLKGSATIPQLDARGTVSPGGGIGTLRARTTTFADGATLALELSAADAYDQLDVTGGVSLSGEVNLTLEWRAGFDPAPGKAFTIIRNDGTDPIAVAFAPGRFRYAGNLLDPEETFSADGRVLRISYAGGDGNDVTLISVPEPGAAVAFALGAMLVLRRQRTAGAAASS